MNTTAIMALIRNDLRLYRADRRAVIVGILMPILIAAFFGYLFRQNNSSEDAGKVPIAVVDEDGSAVTRAIITQISGDSLLLVTPLARDAAREQVRKGTQQAAAVFPKGFGEQSVGALFTGRDKPKVELFMDPSQAMSSRLVQGLLAQYSMQEISKEAFNGAMGKQNMDRLITDLDAQPATEQRRDLIQVLQAVRRLNDLQATTAADGQGNVQPALSIPYEVAATSVTSGTGTPYNSFAHSFAGMSVQFILFAGVDAGIVLLLLRQRGLWQRIRAAPISRGEFVLARVVSTALISVFQVAVVYLVAMLAFGVRIQGSLMGFILVAGAFCLLNAAFGLMLATLGRSAPATRGIATMVMLLLVMMGGAWVPTFVFPQWLQAASRITPTYWAVNGLDAMTWRGLPFTDALLPAAVLCGSALLCLVVAIWRFRWEE
jgi:ABC-2 type transport system permease protein